MTPATLAKSTYELLRAIRGMLKLSMLRRKLWADSRALAGQTISLMVLIGLGICLFVGLYQAYQNLTLTYDTIYETTLFANASVLMQSAPEGLVERAKTIPHVREAIGRAVKDGTIIQKGRKRERVAGRFIGFPRNRRPVIDDLWLTQGHYISGPDDAVVEHQFAAETGYEVGDTIKCAYYGREREFVIVGFAVSPEYVYPVPSKNTMFVARGTFGVVFIDEDRAREWLGVGRQITEIHTLTDPGYEEEVLEKLEGLARPHGLETSYVQDDQPSKSLLALDQQGFATLSVFFPILFLSSAGLSLYGAIARIMRLQVTIIGMLKACGFRNAEILLQYVGQGGMVALAGAVPGAALGHLLSVGMGRLYAGSLKLPIFFFAPHWDTIVTGLILAVATGLLASYLPAKMAAKLPPAVAMRGELDTGAGIAAQRRLVAWIRLSKIAFLIPLRGIFRRASRTLLAVAGIAGGTSIIITTFGMHVSTMDAIDEFLTNSRRYQIDLAFTSPAGMELARAVSSLPGARGATRTTSLPVRVRSSWGEGELILTGLEAGQSLLHIRTLTEEPLDLRPGEVWLPKQVVKRLQVEPGDPVEVEWVKASRRRPVRRTMRVAGVLNVSMGNSAYGEFNDVRRAFTDKVYPDSSYGAFLACDPSQTEALKHRLERSDDVAMVSTTDDVVKEIDEQMSLMFVFIGVLLSFGAVLAGSTIQSVSSVSILERTRELATLRSLGFSSRATGLLVSVELLFLAVLGLAAGLPLGSWLNALFMASYNTENMTFRPILPLWVHVTAVLMVVTLVVISSISGARRLARMDLAQATKARE